MKDKMVVSYHLIWKQDERYPRRYTLVGRRPVYQDVSWQTNHREHNQEVAEGFYTEPSMSIGQRTQYNPRSGGQLVAAWKSHE